MTYKLNLIKFSLSIDKSYLIYQNRLNQFKESINEYSEGYQDSDDT